MKEHQLIITRKPNGNYTIDVYVPRRNGRGADLVTTMGAAKNSPTGQCVKLLERLIDLAKKVAGYEG